MRDLSELFLRRTGSAPSAETVRAFEVHFQVTLPADYLRFLSLANGGEPMLNCTFDFTTTSGKIVEDADQVKEFISLIDDKESWGGVWQNTQFLRNVFSDLCRDTNVVCIGWNGEGDTIYLNFATASPSVCILYRDCGDITPKVADSFEEFLKNLHPRW